MILVTGHNFTYTDVDSILGSIVLAKILNHRGFKAKPVIINPQAILQSSIDIIGRIGDIPMPELVSKEDIEKNDLALVDHNNPLESYAALGISKVPIMCVDHHTDAGTVIKEKIIERVGSTCTILVEMLKEENIRVPDLLAKALVFGIACDTKGLKSRKVTTKDFDMIDYLYNEYHIGIDISLIVQYVLVSTDVLNMSIEQILENSLKEYAGGKIGIASCEVLNDDYKTRLDEVMKEGWNTKYELYVFMVFKQHTDETLVYYFDKKYNCFPRQEHFNQLVSRSHDIVPYVLRKTETMLAGIS